MTDWYLLRQYRDRNSNDAFRKLADRHMKLVYSTCRRDLSDAHAAEDATQLVFILLARKAKTINRGASIPSWLFSTARYVCRDLIKSEIRCRRREAAVQIMEAPAEDRAEWNVVEPLLNDALASLTPSDREAVLLRYYAGMSLKEIAGQIGTSDDTARKRVSRALERLRRYIQGQQATAQLQSLDTLLLLYAPGSVPPQTQAAVMSTLQNLGATPGTLHAHAGVLLKKGAFAIMDATTKKILVALAVAAMIGVGIGGPVLVAHIWQQRLSAGDTALLIDAAPAVQNDTQSGDRSQLLEMMRNSVHVFARRDLANYTKDFDPGMVLVVPGQPNSTVGQLVQQDQKVFKMLGPFNLTETIEGVQIRGNTAQIQTESRISGTTVNFQQVPGGLPVVIDSTVNVSLRKENGVWRATRMDVSSTQDTMAGRVVFQAPPPRQ